MKFDLTASIRRKKPGSNRFDSYRLAVSSPLKSAHLKNPTYYGFEAYQRCYDRETKNQEFFASLEKQAQWIVHRLLRN
jgi:hypothetical protein